jgi:hypothetical protein
VEGRVGGYGGPLTEVDGESDAVAVVADEGHWQLPAGRRQDWRRLLFRPTEVDFADGVLAATNGKEW